MKRRSHEASLKSPHLYVKSLYVKRMRNERVLIRSSRARGKVGNALCAVEGSATLEEAFFTFPWAVFLFPLAGRFMEYWQGFLVRRRSNQGMEGMDSTSAQERTRSV